MRILLGALQTHAAPREIEIVTRANQLKTTVAGISGSGTGRAEELSYI
jgi:hypothetical protein